METLLVQSGRFRLPGKRQLQQPDSDWEVLVVDVTEVEIERPKKKQRRYYSGKQKCHTLKAQLVVDLRSGQFVAVACGKGRTHDLRLFKHSKVHFCQVLLCLADKGYQGFVVRLRREFGELSRTELPKSMPTASPLRRNRRASHCRKLRNKQIEP